MDEKERPLMDGDEQRAIEEIEDFLGLKKVESISESAIATLEPPVYQPKTSLSDKVFNYIFSHPELEKAIILTGALALPIVGILGAYYGHQTGNDILKYGSLAGGFSFLGTMAVLIVIDEEHIFEYV